jgi:hypothetical protein
MANEPNAVRWMREGRCCDCGAALDERGACTRDQRAVRRIMFAGSHCVRAKCGHPEIEHRQATGCRIQGCACAEFIATRKTMPGPREG